VKIKVKRRRYLSLAYSYMFSYLIANTERNFFQIKDTIKIIAPRKRFDVKC